MLLRHAAGVGLASTGAALSDSGGGDGGFPARLELPARCGGTHAVPEAFALVGVGIGDEVAAPAAGRAIHDILHSCLVHLI